MEKTALIEAVLERFSAFANRALIEEIVEATIAVLFNAEHVNARHCPCCRTATATIVDDTLNREVA